MYKTFILRSDLYWEGNLIKGKFVCVFIRKHLVSFLQKHKDLAIAYSFRSIENFIKYPDNIILWTIIVK